MSTPSFLSSQSFLENFGKEASLPLLAMAASYWTGVDYDDSPSPPPPHSSTSHPSSLPAAPEPASSPSPTARSHGLPTPADSASPTARSRGPPTPPCASAPSTPRSGGPQAPRRSIASSTPGAATSPSPSSAAAGRLASASTSFRLRRRRRWGPPVSTFPEETSSSVVSITADADIQIHNIPGLHDWIQCGHNRASFTSVLAYASQTVLTEEIRVPGSIPRLMTSRATREVLIVLRRWYHIFWSMHKAGYGLSGKFGAENFVVYHESIPQLDVRLTGRLHLVRFTPECGNMDYSQFVKTVKSMFHAHGGAVPPHVQEWLDLMNRGYKGEEYLIRYNSALMDPTEAFQSTMLLYHMLEELEGSALYDKIVNSFCDEYKNWCCYDLLDNRYMDWARRYTLKKSRLKEPFKSNIMGVLKVARDCSEHPARGMIELMIFIAEQDFHRLVSYLHSACFKGGLLQKLNLEATLA